METKKKGFIVHENFYEQVQLLSTEECGRLFLAMFEYHKSGTVPKGLSPLLTMAFIGIRQAMDQDYITYERRCDANRENGKKGGRPPKKVSASKTQKPKKPDNDNDNGNDIDIDIDNDIDIGNGNGIGNDMDIEGYGDGGAPLPSVSDGSAGVRHLSEAEKKDLISFGVPAAYVKEREARAEEYGALHGKSVFDVLLSWWREDRGVNRKPRREADGVREIPKSYDLDEFFEAAIRRGLREADETSKEAPFS